MKVIVWLIICIICLSCSSNRSILSKIQDEYKTEQSDSLNNEYIQHFRKEILQQNKKLLKDFRTLLLIEEVSHWEQDYYAAIFSDSLIGYYKARGGKVLEKVNLSEKPEFKPEILIYIADLVHRGEIKDVLEQANQSTYTYQHPASIFITILNKSDKDVEVEGYKIRAFMTREKIEEMRRIRERTLKHQSEQ